MQSPELGYLRNVHRSVLDALQSAAHQAQLLKFEGAARDCRRVSGALHLSRFEGAARVMDDAAEFALAIQKKTLDSRIEQPVDAFCKALDSVKQYVLDILADAPDVPMKLWEAYRTLRLGRKQGAHPSQLFFPLVKVAFWSPVNQSKSFDEKKLQERRSQFASALLPWVKDPTQTHSLGQARLALEGLLSEQPMGAGFVGFIKAAIAALDTVSQKTNSDSFDRLVFGRIDQELKNFAEQRALPAEEAWRYLLYVVAFGQIQSRAVLEVKEKHRLNEYVELIKNESRRHGKTLDEQALLPVKEALSNVKDAWGKLVQNSGSIHDLERPVKQLSERLPEFNHPAIKRLGDALFQLTHGLKTGNVSLTPALSEEIATMLMLVEQAVEAKGRVSLQYEQSVLTQIQRTLAAVKGDAQQLQSIPSPQVDEESIKRSQRALRIQVLTEVKIEMQAAEEALDVWFKGEDENKEEVIQTARPLKRLVAILQMSRLPEAAKVLTEVISGLESLLGKGRNNSAESDKANVSGKMAALGLYLDAEMAEQADALRFLGVEPVQAQSEKDHVSIPAPAPLYVQPVHAPAAPPAAPKIQFSAPKPTIQEPPAPLVGDEDVVVNDEMLDIYLEDFVEQLDTMKRGSMVLSRDLKNKEALGDIRRAFHTLKGSGRMVSGLERLPNASEKIELFLKKWIGEERPATPQLMNAIDEAINIFEGWRDELSRHHKVKVLATELLAKFNPAKYPEYQDVYTSAEATVEVIAPAQAPEPQPAEPVVSKNVFVGDIVVDRELYDMYLVEAKQSVQVLVRDWALACHSAQKAVSKAFMGAGHKLGSSSKTIGFGELAEVSYLLERWAERHLDGGEWIGQKEAEDVGQLVSHAEGLFNAIVEKERLVLNKALVQQVEAHLHSNNTEAPKSQVVQAPVWAAKDSGDAELKKKIRAGLEKEIASVRAHLGALESLLMLVDTEE